MIYLASVYSLNSDKELRQKRYEFVLKKTAELVSKGLVVYSPIVHNHPLSLVEELPGTWEFWCKFDKAMLDKADLVWVLKMDGWEDSVGISAEVEYALSLGLEVDYLDVSNSPPAGIK